MNKGLKIFIIVVGGVILSLADQLLKVFCLRRGTFFINQHIAFGIPLHVSIIYWLVVLTLLALVVWWVWLVREGKLTELAAVSLVIFGALSNLVDRLAHGHVIDYINFPHFSIFNLADIMIVAGAILLTYIILKTPTKNAN